MQMANSLWTPMVFSILIIESIYHLLVISVHVFSSIIMIIFQLATLVRTKLQNQFAADISGPVSALIYNNSASSMSLIYNLSYNVTSLTDLSNNSLFLNNHRIPFLQTLLRNFYYSLSLILFQLLLTSSLNRQSLFLPMISLCLQTQYVCLFFIYSSNIVFLSMSPLTEVWSWC